jgi:hypothetical protein
MGDIPVCPECGYEEPCICDYPICEECGQQQFDCFCDHNFEFHYGEELARD